MSRSYPGDGVGNLVEKHLVNLIIGGGATEVSGDTDSLLSMVALTKAGLGMVEIKRPARIQVESNQRVCPDSHPRRISHGHRLAS